MVGWDFAGGPVAKTSPSNAEDGATIPGLRAKIPASCAQDQKEKNRKGLKLSSSVQSLSHV